MAGILKYFINDNSVSTNHLYLQPRGLNCKGRSSDRISRMHMKGVSSCRQMVVFVWELILEREENQSTLRKTRKSGWDRLKLNPSTIVEVGGANVEYNAKLTSQGILHRDTRMVAHLDIHSAQQDLTSVFKWELVFSLGQAVWMALIPLLWIRMATDC